MNAKSISSAQAAKLFEQYVRARNAADGRRAYRKFDAMVDQLEKADRIAGELRAYFAQAEDCFAVAKPDAQSTGE